MQRAVANAYCAVSNGILVNLRLFRWHHDMNKKPRP